MRLTTSLSLSLGLVAFGWILSPAVSQAQDEFDDFDDAFDEPEPAPAAEPADDEFDDLEDDAFGDEDLEDDAGLEDGDLEDEDFADEDDEADEDEPSAVAERRAYRDRRHIMHNTWGGPVGGFHVVDAGSGADAAFRTQLGIDFFVADGWLTLQDATAAGRPQSHSHIGGSLSLSWTPWEFLEIYGSIASWANSNPQEDPTLFQVLGDTTIGIKGSYHFEDVPVLYIGGDINLNLLNTVGDIGVFGDSTGFGLRANLTVDLRELEEAVPFIARLNVGYVLDNSSALVSGVERARYNALTDPMPCPEDPALGDCFEERHLITRVERYSLQIDRVDRLRIAIGIEAPLSPLPDFYISPIVEYVVDIPINRQGFSCLLIEGTGTPGVPAAGHDGCLDTQGGDAFEQRLTLGVRVVPPLRGLNLFAAVDIGLTGVNTFVRELSGQEPYDVRLGFGYAFDTVPVIEEVEREVVREVSSAPPPQGRIMGLVVEQGEGTAIGGATIAFVGSDFTSQLSGSDGHFTGYRMDPGEVQMIVTHPDFHDGSCTATIPDPASDVEVRCELEALPRLGSVRGTVTGDSGSAVGGATVQLSGPSNHSLVTGPDGAFTVSDIPPGTYLARVEAEAFFIKQDSFEVVAREQATPTITLISRPRQPLVRIRARTIVIRRQVNFATDSADILPDSDPLLTEVADVILRHPEIMRIEIQGHTDNRGGRQHNMDLSQRRAESVRDWLVRAGIEATRFEARGYGPDNPAVPNITAANRARNRRVAFIIREQADEP